MKPRLVFPSVCLLCLCTLIAGAQEFVTRTLPTQSHLPVSSIHCILQDKEGYLWYGTEEAGVCRDNGYQIDVFQPSRNGNHNSVSNSINCMAEDSRGRIILGTKGGLFCIDKRDYSLKSIPAVKDGTPVDALHAGRNKQLWFATRGCIAAADTTDSVSVRYPCRIAGKETSVADLYEDSNGTLFALLWPPAGGDAPGILCKEADEREFTPLDWPLRYTPIQIIEDRQHHCYWILTRGAGIVKMALEGRHCRITPQPATTGSDGRSRGLSMLRDNRYGLFWCTTMDNLYLYAADNHGQLQRFPTDGFLPEGNKILDQLLESRDGDIYVAGFTPHTFVVMPEQNGVKRTDAPAISRLTGYPLLPDCSIKEDGHFWIWQGRKGLVLYDPATDRLTVSPYPADKTCIRRTAGGIYASQGRRLYHFWKDAGMNIRREELPGCDSAIRLLYEDHRQTLYAATEHRLYRLSPSGGAMEHTATLPCVPYDMCADRRGHVYLALGTRGLHRVTPQKGTTYLVKTGEDFQTLCVAPDGAVWTATHEGNVYRLMPDSGLLQKEKFLCREDGTPIKDILADGMGHIWTLTDQEVREYEPASHSFRTIRNTDPFANVSYFYRLEQPSPDRIIINAAGALLQTTPSTLLGSASAESITPHVSAVCINGEKQITGRQYSYLMLKPDAQELTLWLTTLDHRNAGSISFAYRLPDINRNWTYLPQGNNTVVLNNLPTGNHVLELKATDRYGCWSPPVKTLDITKEAHWYETWWAYLIYIGLSTILLYCLWRLERRIRLLRRLIQRKREVRLDEIEIRREEITGLQRKDEFLKSAISKIEEHLNQPDYNVEALSSDLCMSRITLYRHIQEQTGQSPTELIRDIRLKKAARLLVQTPEASITDIAVKVGFSSPRYFSKCFKEKFGMLPKEYRREKQTE